MLSPKTPASLTAALANAGERKNAENKAKVAALNLRDIRFSRGGGMIGREIAGRR
jgi:hypothetical protein